jgi:hypothetical protein
MYYNAVIAKLLFQLCQAWEIDGLAMLWLKKGENSSQTLLLGKQAILSKHLIVLATHPLTIS